ncbi:hypothetical protein AAHA92_29594 [Salvia divinorum]|uniref:Uncharacterized protein n=1 Tax=Salvia divinorum TaxID=28513 RepID=A0ABD1FYV8_SALDI
MPLPPPVLSPPLCEFLATDIPVGVGVGAGIKLWRMQIETRNRVYCHRVAGHDLQSSPFFVGEELCLLLLSHRPRSLTSFVG